MADEQPTPPEQGGDNVSKEGTEGNPNDVKEGSKAPTTLDKYHEENDRREALLKREEALQERRETLHAEQMLGGGSDAGQAPPKPKDSTPEDYAKQVMAGEISDEKES